MEQHFGSVHYFSPEHAKGGITDAKSDVYSLGVVMYEMLTGKVPFDADTPVSVALKHMQEEPISPIELNTRIPSAINDIILKALKKDTRLRYQSATEILLDLKAALRNPEGDFVENIDDDPTARTQILKTSNEENRNRRKIDDARKNGNEETKKVSKKRKKIIIVFSILIILLASIGITFAVLNANKSEDVDIINIVNMDKDEAKSLIEELGLIFEIESEEYDVEIEEGYIISQDPEYSENYGAVKVGSTVSVVVSKGQEKVTMIKVVGLKQDEATKQLEDLGLNVEIVEATSQTVEEGYVISQAIAEDEEILASETVQITVSSGTGIKQVALVSVIGSTEEDARFTLESLGLVVEVGYAQNSSQQNGVVTAQSITKGNVVDEGTTVTITVNSYNETVSIPVSINLKSITGGYTEVSQNDSSDDENSNNTSLELTDAEKKVNIKITVDGETYYTTSGTDKNNTNFTTSIKAEETNKITVVLTVTEADGTGKEYVQTEYNFTVAEGVSISFE